MAATKKSSQSGTKKQSGKKSSGSTRSTQNDASGLRELFEDELKDIYWAEKALVKAIPKMIKNATSEELIAALEDHLEVTEEQVSRCEEIFNAIGTKPQAKKCEGMTGLIKEAEDLMSESEEGVVRDAAIISAAQKVEHYEIASYGTLRAFANTLQLEDVVGLIEETLNEEKDADVKLTQIAESSINISAANEDNEEGEEEEEEMEEAGKSSRR